MSSYIYYTLVGYNDCVKTIPKHTLKFIDSWLELRSKWDDASGFSVAIAKDGKVIFNKAYGYADVEKKEKMTSGQVFRVASHSKTYTATAIMQLQEKGKLRIDDHVVNYLPWLKEHSDKRWQKVTIRQLLSHSAGVIRDGLNSEYWELRCQFPDTKQLHKAILESDLVLEPNTKMKYSNYGYSLLGEIIEEASGVSYNEYVTKNIVDVLGLKNTTPEINDEIEKKLCRGYTRQNIAKERLPFPHVSTHAMSAATGFCSNASELCIFYSAQLIGTEKLLSDDSKREMQHSQWKVNKKHAEYGLGLDIETIGGRRVIGHSGGFPGFVSRSHIDVEDAISVVVLANCQGAATGKMAQAVYSILDEFGDEAPKQKYLKYEGRFVSLYGVFEIIAQCNGLRGVWPNSWWPLDEVDKLEIVDDSTLKIIDTDGYSSEGEYIKLHVNTKGRVESISHSGSYMPASSDGDFVQTWE